MKICIFGAGAIGSIFAARFASIGQQVSVIARGQTYDAISQTGIGIETPDAARKFYPVKGANNLADLPEQDVIIISVKEPALLEIAQQIAPHLSSKTQILLAMNGVPWWFLDGLAHTLDDPILNILDPHSNLRELLPTSQLIGGVVHLSGFSPAPGVGHLRAGNKVILGRPNHEQDQFLNDITALFCDAGFDGVKSEFIHKDIWFKLWGNMTMNPISALTRTTTDKILDDPLTHEFVCKIMTEANEIGTALGLGIDTSPEERNSVTRSLGAMRTSMLQDIEQNRQLEHEALIGAVSELAAKIGYPAPHINILYGLIRLLART